MKQLIKQLLRENLLTEKLAIVDEDVNFLYDKYFKKDIDKIAKTGRITKNMFKKSFTETGNLKSEESVMADEKNKCVININGGNFYSPKNNTIAVGVSLHALDFVLNDVGGDLNHALDNLSDASMRISLSGEFTEEKIKGSIHHELAHWLDDTFHNFHITKRIEKQMQKNTRDLKNIPVNVTNFEIEAQMHNIKQLYNKYSEIWDNLTFIDMISKSPSLISVYNSTPKTFKDAWLKKLKSRMYREGLLGKNMVS